MTTIPYWHVDAFADAPFKGNQAAVMPLDSWLPDAVMQAIAAENNFAETAFVVRDAGGSADYELRWFTPTMEIRLCGHATLATGHVLLSDAQQDAITFCTRKSGELQVSRKESGYEVRLPAIPVQKAMNHAASALLGAVPESVWRNEDGYEIYLFAEESMVRDLVPDFRGLEKLGSTVFIATAAGRDTDIVSRVFVPGGGIDEDPVTGGAHACLVPFWADRLGRTELSAFQASRRGGHLSCRLDGGDVWLGGDCVTVVKGEFYLTG